MTLRKKKENKQGSSLEGLEFETLSIQGTEYKTLYTQKFRNRKTWVAHDPKKIVSILPGTIMEVFITKGQKLIDGTPLLILEAMKMRTKINMTGEGVVKDINVAIGDKIPKGHLLIELEK
jgi:biotin carboxyl carrier protein